MEVPDSDNNSTKESVEFSEPSFRTNFAESLGSRFENRVTDFSLPVGSYFKTEREREREDLTSEHRESWCVLFERSGALFIALWEGYFSLNPTEQFQRFSLNRCNCSFQPQQPSNRPTAAMVYRQPLRGAVRIRIAEPHTRETRFKKNQAG